MQDGAATLLKRHLSLPYIKEDSHRETVFRMAYHRLIARDKDAWTSGQWMTERIGGSDVSGTETLATYSPDLSLESTEMTGSPLGPWVIDGFKWFSSATDSQMSIALAQTPKGLSAFYIPMRRTTADGSTELNGISISRLKNKMGTKALPTAELELKGSRAYLLGEEGHGIREISTVLNITRIHTAVAALGHFGRGLAIAKAFTNVRQLAGRGKMTPLKDMPLHIHTLAETTLSYRANMLFAYFTIYLLGISDQAHPTTTSQKSTASHRLRPQSAADIQLFFRYIPPTPPIENPN
jgi:alkylation response protein AidB-like acyl-CoA dehydrogenase